MSSATSRDGRHRTWLDGISTVAAPRRLANARSASAEGLIVGGDQTRTQRFPGWDAHHVARRRTMASGCLHGVHNSCRYGIDVGGEVLEEVVLGQPAEAAGVGEQVRSAGVGGPGTTAAGIHSWSSRTRDVDQAAELGASALRAVMTAAVGVPGDKGGGWRSVLGRGSHPMARRRPCWRASWSACRRYDDAAPQEPGPTRVR